MKQKGFTLIELLIVIAIIGILAAVAIPTFIRIQEEYKAEENVKNGISVSSVENIDVRRAMIDILEKTQSDEQKIANAEKIQNGESNNTGKTVLKGSEVPQSDYNTVEPVLNNFPKRYTQIQCGGDGFIKGCTLLFRQGDNQYIIPMSCEVTDTNTYTCEVR